MEECIYEIVEEACKKFYENDRYLINHRVNERAIAFRFGIYLQELISKNKFFDNYNLDNEYNRNMNDPKRLRGCKNGVYPDLIIHQRGSNKYNLLIIECKTKWNSDVSGDIRKIRKFVDIHDIYKYRYGLSILFECQYVRCIFIEYGKEDSIKIIKI